MCGLILIVAFRLFGALPKDNIERYIKEEK